eukprot:TRINITY_DN81055_c0_g1_i1.p1 TRINITY_DN81055_c0_g1~~TRINITY_DN81055_c0_g1_i1.p1  ORF type:complete len:307 (+),score=50.93 TRINITY_DN81055_c0_g1_i1:107-922(+)
MDDDLLRFEDGEMEEIKKAKEEYRRKDKMEPISAESHHIMMMKQLMDELHQSVNTRSLHPAHKKDVLDELIKKASMIQSILDVSIKEKKEATDKYDKLILKLKKAYREDAFNVREKLPDTFSRNLEILQKQYDKADTVEYMKALQIVIFEMEQIPEECSGTLAWDIYYLVGEYVTKLKDMKLLDNILTFSKLKKKKTSLMRTAYFFKLLKNIDFLNLCVGLNPKEFCRSDKDVEVLIERLGKVKEPEVKNEPEVETIDKLDEFDEFEKFFK